MGLVSPKVLFFSKKCTTYVKLGLVMLVFMSRGSRCIAVSEIT